MLKKLVVCGVGLIGGSFALGLKAAGKVESVLGLGRTRGPLEEACRLGVIDRIADGWADALAGAELVLLATPVGQMEAVFTALAPHLGPGTIITDGGSTKTDVVAAARAGLGNKIGQFIPGHPIAGAEKSGVAAAKPDLYADRRVVLTPLAENSPADVARLQSIWEACGAKVSRLAPEEHDRVFAAVSHLPHLLAFALVHDFAQRPNSDQLFGFAAGGFRDFTRIASSHPEMWRDICVANRGALLQELDAYMLELMRTRVLLAGADAAGLESLFSTARARRDAWLDSLLPPGE
ncbi:MAG: prephenate dehydrogenase/arogenate dehydrogenase family protein [Sulfuritalea sp.]|jgi:prephenate dehydrogenase|nr:prephenate dehydrogenase/arogenate dehydrogenase family protein [Sulfuritalea sp.]MBK9351793.1 prephenate dehydrogenase/arogenate dehydrogenase family protein [Sulfuritalea sp.]